MKNEMRLTMLGFLTASIFALPVHADFGVVGDQELYGNAQTEEFRRATTGGAPLSLEEQAYFASLLPEREDQRFYGRLALSFGGLTLSNITNRSTQSSGFQGVTFTNKAPSTNPVGLQLAVGYIWSDGVRADIEYLVNRNLKFTSGVVFANSTSQITGVLTNNTFLVNFYYEYTKLPSRLRPYLTAGLGIAANSIVTTLTPGGTNRSQKFGLAWSLGVGIRFGIFSRWYLDANYRYIGLGNNVTMFPAPGFKVTAAYNMSAVSLGLIYLF